MSGRVTAEQAPDIEAIADWLGAMDESRNIFDITDEATTIINIDVETLAARFADRLAAAVREARAAAWDEGYEAAEYMARCWGHTDHWEDEPENPYRADRIAVDAPEGGA